MDCDRYSWQQVAIARSWDFAARAPRCDARDVLIRPIAAGICAGDMQHYGGRNPYTKYPLVCGHEVCGEVVETGGEVQRFKRGDLVVIEPVVGCGHCYSCRHGKPNCCMNFCLIGLHRPGGYAELCVAPEANVHVIPAGLDPVTASFAEPLAIGIHACRRGAVAAVHPMSPAGEELDAHLAELAGRGFIQAVDTWANEEVQHGMALGRWAQLADPAWDFEAAFARFRAGYKLLDLITYFTVGPKETRAWTIKQGDTAPEAAGVIHTDFQRGFIKAEVVSFDDLVAAGDMQTARSAGKVRIEGKDYVMADGDVVEFRFNV